MTTYAPASRAAAPMRSVVGLGTTTAWSTSRANQASSPSQIGTESIQIGVPGTNTSGNTINSGPLAGCGVADQLLDLGRRRLAIHQHVGGLHRRHREGFTQGSLLASAADSTPVPPLAGGSLRRGHSPASIDGASPIHVPDHGPVVT